MRRAAPATALALAAALAGCAVEPSRPQPPATPATPAKAAAAPAPLHLRNAGFEAPPETARRCPAAWDCTVHNDAGSFKFMLADSGAAGGTRSLCIERVGHEPWALATQSMRDPALRGARVRLSMAVRLEGVSGEGAGPWALVQSKPPVHVQRLVRGTSGWQRVSVDLAMPGSEIEVQVGGTLEGGGRACFDDVRLEALPR